MNQIVTHGIVLRRTNYGEADRIVHFLTPDQGKISLVAKGARRLKSKMAGGIELFSISSLTFIRGRSDLGTLVSARLEAHYGEITKDINRVQLGYELIKLIDKNTEDEPGSIYFSLLNAALGALNDDTIDIQLIKLWLMAQILRHAGHTPNLQADSSGTPLEAGKTYGFDHDTMSFAPGASRYDTNDIKFLRLLFNIDAPAPLMKITDLDTRLKKTAPLVNLWQQSYIH